MTRCLRMLTGSLLALTVLATSITFAQTQPGTAKLGQRQPAGTAPATQKAPTGNTPVVPRGNAAPPVAPRGNAAAPQPAQPKPVDPKLEALLREWEVSSAKIKYLHGKHLRSRTNSVFETDSRASGEFFFESPDKGRIDLEGMPTEKGQASPFKNAKGQPYSLITDREEKWVCDGKQIIVVNEEDKQYESIPIPEDMQGTNIIESPLPFLFGMKAADAKKRFDMDLISVDEKSATIIARPLQQRDAQNFSKAEIVLDRKLYIPVRVMLVDQAETITTRYMFQDVKVNDKGILARLPWGNTPFNPNLRGYQKVQQPVQPVGNAVPQGGAGRVTPANAKAPVGGAAPNTNRPNSTTQPRTTFQSQGAGASTGTRTGVK